MKITKELESQLKHLNLKYYKTYNKKIVKGMKITYVKCDSYRILKSEYIKINRKVIGYPITFYIYKSFDYKLEN